MRDRPILSQVTWYPFSRTLNVAPEDLLIAVLYVVIVGPLAGFGLVENVGFRTALGLPLVLFLPGYVLVSALFPAEHRAGDRRTDRRLGTAHRLALSVGASVALLSVVGVAFSVAGLPFAPVPVVTTLGTLVVLGAVVAAARRSQVPTERRYALSPSSYVARFRAWLFAPDGRGEVLLNGTLAVAVFVSLVAVGYAVAVPADGESFTDFYVGSEEDDEYPTEFTLGQERTVPMGVENHEDEPASYTVVVQLQQVSTTGDEVTVEAADELDRRQIDVADGERWTGEQAVAPTMAGEDLRLVFLLYLGDAPADASTESAYENLYLWVDVTDAEDGDERLTTDR